MTAFITIHARKSDLARIQAYQVGQALQNAHRDLKINYHFRSSLGDQNLQDPLWKIPEKGVFTRDFHQDLIARKCDVVVHSWKDLPVEESAETEIIASLPRADCRDLILFKKSSIGEIASCGRIKILTSSLRRIHHLSDFLRWALPVSKSVELSFEDVRGNIPTRLSKLLDPNSRADAIVVAKAALDRLLQTKMDEFTSVQLQIRSWLSEMQWMMIPLSVNPGAAAQGALAVEALRSRDDLKALFLPICCKKTMSQVQREREILASFGGGCHQKIGVTHLNHALGEVQFLKGVTDDGTILNEIKLMTSTSHSIPPCKDPSKLWPLHSEESQQWFVRTPQKTDQELIHGRDLWVSRTDALPSNWNIPMEQIVWVSGLNTWKQLAKRGVWVHGSSESLGEDEEVLIETLLGRELRWIKLSHQEGYPTSNREMLATYTLQSRGQVPDLKGKIHFYWSSGTIFLEALKHFPEILNGWHGCGPGNTLKILLQKIPKERVQPYLNHSHWLHNFGVASKTSGYSTGG